MNTFASFDDLFSAETVADTLSVSKRSIEAWAKNGKLVPVLDPKSQKKMYRKEQLKEFPEFSSMFSSDWDKESFIKPVRDFYLVELFAGAGGLALGLDQAGFKSVLLNEKDKYACQTLRANRPHWNVLEEKIENVSFSEWEGKVDLVTGGFPCQSFSYAGKQLGLEDIRGTLVFEMLRAVKEIQPKAFLAENVKGLMEHDKGKTLEVILSVIEEIGYKVVVKELFKSVFYKVPQKRERFIIIGVRADLADKFIFNKPSPYYRILNLRDALKAGILYGQDVPLSDGQAYPKRKADVLSLVPEGGYWRDLPLEIQKEYMKGSFELGGGKTGMARRLSWDEPSLTLTCSPAQNQTERCHPTETRPLTTREYARIQTFPDDWVFKGSNSEEYRQIGNAVPVNLAAAIGRSLIRAFNDLEAKTNQ